MEAKYKLNVPDEIEAELIVRMTLGEWRTFSEQLDEKWPSWKFGNAITSMLRKAETCYRATGEQ